MHSPNSETAAALEASTSFKPATVAAQHPPSIASQPATMNTMRDDAMSAAPSYQASYPFNTTTLDDQKPAMAHHNLDSEPASQPLLASTGAFSQQADSSQLLHPYHEPSESDRASLLPRPAECVSLDRSASAKSPHAASDVAEMAILSSHQNSHAPSYSDLFFDLLFAACLNTYSSAVSLQKFGDVAAFLGYFTALWWAWWSQAYFDVRYRRSSHDEPFLFKSCQRIVRAAVLGLWVAFATTPSEFARGSFTNFSQIYGYSRIALAVDHTAVLFYDLVYWRKGRHVDRDQDQIEQPDQLPSAHAGRRKSTAVNGISRIVQTHLVSIASLVASGLLWILSRFLRHDGVTAPLLVMWILGVAVEGAAQIVNEVSGVLSPLSSSVLPERLVLFGLIVLGEGFTGISETLNRISPGAKVHNEILGGSTVESGGWSANTVLQAASCVLIVVLQFGGYFHRATNQIDLNSVRIVLWAYIHVLLHMASALLVIGLKKILGFMNTLNALQRFFDDSSFYLPDSPPWQNLTSDQVAQQFNDDGGSSPLSANGTLAGISAIISVIQSNDGANIPTLFEAQRLVASVVGLAGGQEQAQQLAELTNTTQESNPLSSQFAHSLVLPFRSYFEFCDNVINPDSMDQFITNSLFQFKYIYVASAAYLMVDIVIKAMQNSVSRRLRSFRLAMVVRFCFAVVLILLQVVFTVYQGVPSGAALDGALAICAAVLLAELLAQQLVDAFRVRLDRPRPHKRTSILSRLALRKRHSHRPSGSSSSPSSSDKDADQMIEMELHPSPPKNPTRTSQ
ncbi:uncharacterized protein UMAG_05649 [Mycosarcoma maydis]|uniref:Uncharacterized protein n=1 Tax=Mycosarcoma maydis TaxID=5270 RepID=A0A0D1CIS4_MYCMD|nr:uncharacterized protein UMAG_05649 [Ustilago maydis 521]KIS66863.1 hypothetical protein UMAG_05649 [Ustilago maydis 521]|eukprot:XP_011391421.1 hypothetical protein UMAG_05649 [Ustilago maydis 521]